MTIVLIAVMGALGVLCRYAAERAVAAFFPSSFPLGTFLINVAGCALAALITGWAMQRANFPEFWRLGLLVGFCGGFTTFSTYAVQAATLIGSETRVTGLLYFVLSPIVGLAVAWVTLRAVS